MIIALAAIALAAILPMFITNNYHLNLMIQVLINIIIVVGLNFITGLTGQMNLGTAGIFSICLLYTSTAHIARAAQPYFRETLCAHMPRRSVCAPVGTD